MLSRGDIERQWWLAGVLLLLVLVGVDLVSGHQINGVFAAAAVLAAINADPRRTTLVAGLAVLASVLSGVWNDNLGEQDWVIRFASCVLLSVLAVVAADLTNRRRQQLERTTLLAQRELDARAV